MDRGCAGTAAGSRRRHNPRWRLAGVDRFQCSGSGQNWVSVRVWRTGKPGLGLLGALLHSSELATVGRRCARRRHAGGWRSGRWNGLPALTIGLTGRGWKSEAHRGMGLRWEAGQSRRRWSPAVWRQSAELLHGAAGPRSEAACSGKVWASRRSRRAARLGLRRGGAAWPRRRGLCSGRSKMWRSGG